MALKYDVVLFDLDGTLTDSEPGIVKSVQYALEKMGRPDLVGRDLRFFVGPPLLDSFRALGFSIEDSHRAIAFFRERYWVKGVYENSVYRGISAMLRTLRARGAYLGLVTSKPDYLAHKVLERFGLAKYMHVVVARTPEEQHAEKDDLIRRALPEHYTAACMVGDRCFDMEAARKTGMDGIGALYGCGTMEELMQAGATRIAQTPQELADILLGGAPLEKGVFITLEGSDGCGKSTQAAMLGDWLELCGWDVLRTREPGGCPIAERIRGIVLDAKESGMTDVCEALLFAASRAQHVNDVIRPALDAGRIVLCDRFVDSSVVYQGVGRGMGKAWVEEINRRSVDDCVPDRTVVFDIDPAEALRRRCAANAPDRIENTADTGFVRRVYDGYTALAKESPERVRLLDATGAPEMIAERLKTLIAQVL